MTLDTYTPVPDLIRAYAATAPGKAALILEDRQLSYDEFVRLGDRVAAALQREDVAAGESVAICAGTSLEYGCAFFGALIAGVAMAPIAPSSTPDGIAAMAADCGAKVFFVDKAVADAMGAELGKVKARIVGLDAGAPGVPFAEFLAPEGAKPAPVAITEELPFNIIYSSGTTGAPKGIVQSHGMRFW